MADEIPKNTKASPEEKSSSAAEESVSDASAAPSKLLSVTSTEMQRGVASRAEGGTLSTTGARPKTKKDAGLNKAATKKVNPQKGMNLWSQRKTKKRMNRWRKMTNRNREFNEL
ncbi:hypothetical protein CDAR_301581 [Caerostris darwini]|uniref:Uncharacterized protein n=1 Tax=Caerostris darwini TaxID=1538125 RepID=A0AAV4TRU6_9ARAC|nr:hypothetical protein CDAR_301581 [Caerostris darwini]